MNTEINLNTKNIRRIIWSQNKFLRHLNFKVSGEFFFLQVFKINISFVLAFLRATLISNLSSKILKSYSFFLKEYYRLVKYFLTHFK